jgi:Flp pilus assembly protein TadD
MARTSQASKRREKAKKILAAKNKPTDKTEENKVKEHPKELIAQAINYFQNGDIQNAKKIAKRVIKVRNLNSV